jgi:hypothetical protein
MTKLNHRAILQVDRTPNGEGPIECEAVPLDAPNDPRRAPNPRQRSPLGSAILVGATLVFAVATLVGVLLLTAAGAILRTPFARTLGSRGRKPSLLSKLLARR